jgi:hypothetical protein
MYKYFTYTIRGCTFLWKYSYIGLLFYRYGSEIPLVLKNTNDNKRFFAKILKGEFKRHFRLK